MSAIDDIHEKLRSDGLLNATEAVMYAQHQLKPVMAELTELRRIVDSLRGIAADAVADEREACAKIAENHNSRLGKMYSCACDVQIATAIRARSKP